ncbi:MAG: DMT family transporter [Burkholderiaceae bacterium]|nr:MAG: DMT family transporter [Burkholderiaceae bacterium]
MKSPLNPGVLAALLAAMLFGAGTPLAKLLLDQASPWLLAALLYLGSGLGLLGVRLARRAAAVNLSSSEWGWLAGAVVSGGMVGPVLLMVGLSGMTAAGASLLLNLEGVLTALLAWFVFKENFDRRIALGMLAIVAGSVVLSWPGTVRLDSVWPAMAVAGACLAWAIDNNLTRKVSLADASFIAMVKGLVAGATNLVLALVLGAAWPSVLVVLAATGLGFASYGASLTLFVVGLRSLGTARTGAYFSIAPFFGAALAIGLLGEAVTVQLVAAGVLMAVGVVLHLTERHEHMHTHAPQAHSHEHEHGTGDEHHDHPHDGPGPVGKRHTHWHEHAPIEHRHAHFPDAHHQHGH